MYIYNIMPPQLTQIERERIVALRLKGCRVTDICRQTGITKKTIHFWFRRWQESGSVKAHQRQVYARATTAADDAAIVAAHDADPFLSTRVTSTSYSISKDTVRRRLKDAGKICSRSAKKILMTQAHKEATNEDSPSGNEIKVFCPNCNTEVQHTAEGIQEDQTKILIAKVYHYFECEYEELKKKYGGDLDLTPLSKFGQRTALATGVSEARVLQILKEEKERNAEKREEKKQCRARKRPISTESSTDEESSDDSDGDGGQPSYEQEAQNEPNVNVETLVVKIEPEFDKDQVQTSTIPVQVKAEPPDDDMITNETLATTEPAATKRKGRKIPRSDVTSKQQHTQGEPSTSTASRSVRLKEVPDESGLLGEADIKVEELEIGDEQFT